MTGFGTSLTPTQAVISLRSYLNAQGPTQQTILNFTSANSFTAAAGNVLTVTVTAGTSDFTLDLPTLFAAFTAPLLVSIADITNPGLGFTWSTVSAGDKQTVGENCFLAWIADGATALEPLFIDNPSASDLILSVGVMSN